jgi:hypothetical protein
MKFKIYTQSVTYYVAEVEAESAEDIIIDNIDSDEFTELSEIEWQVLDIVEAD